MSDWKIIIDANDLPEYDYDVTHKLYLCITESGKTLVCKYKTYHNYNGTSMTVWENASYSRDMIGTVIAYKEIHIPEHILTLCKGAGIGKQHVEYFDGLK